MRTKFFRVFIALMALALVVAPVSARSTPTIDSATSKGVSVIPTAKTLSATIETVYDESSLKNAIQLDDGRISVIVQLSEPPLALYTGGVPNLEATSPIATGQRKLDAQSAASQAYIQYLQAQQDLFINQVKSVAPSAEVSEIGKYQVAFNGVSLKVNRAEVSRIAMLSGVERIYPDQRRTIQMDASLPLIKAAAMWAQLGGQAEAGKGIKVADVDTGLDVKNPMFSGAGFTAPPGYPKGFCVTNPADPDFKCNGKVIVGRFFFDPAVIGGGTILEPLEVMTPFGIASHGTHTAGTITGNPITATVGGLPLHLSGVAPAAYLMVYKGLFGIIEADGTHNGSGTDTMLIAALNAALADGADVINNSWGGGAGDPNGSIYKPLIGAITAAGTLVVFSAGNSGPGAGTIGCPGCVEDALTVAASTTSRTFTTTLVLTNVSTSTITVPPAVQSMIGPSLADHQVQAKVVDLQVEGVADNIACAGPLPTGVVSGTITIVRRGTCALVDKVANAYAGHAVGVVIRNVAGGATTLPLIQPVLPTVHISRAAGDALFTFLTAVKAAGATATYRITTPITIIPNGNQADMIASFSSVGPDGDPNVLKPDIAAPGVDIISASSPALFPTGSEPWFELLQGTSMAAPHITGSAALMMQLHPDWTPLQVKTALTSTSVQSLTKPDGVTPADPFDMGSGRVDLERASKAGITFGKPSFANSSCMSVCSWTTSLTNVTGAETTFNAVAASVDARLKVTVSPATVTLPAGASTNFTVSADVSDIVPPAWYFGSVVWSDATGTYTDAYLPVAVRAGATSNSASLNETVDKPTVDNGEELTYTIKVSNPYPITTTFTVESQLADSLTYKPGSAVGLNYITSTHTLTGVATLGVTNIDVVPTGAPTKYVAGNPLDPFTLDLTSACPGSDPTCDEVVFRITGMNYVYMGTHYSEIRVSSNGFASASTSPISSAATPQLMPNPASPNSVIAPLWSDLEFGAGAYWLIWGTPTETVIEWQNAQAFNDPSKKYNFEIWFVDGTDQITFAYGPLSADVAAPTPTYSYGVGIENINGTAGKTYFYNGSAGPKQGTPPATGTDLAALNQLPQAAMTFHAFANLLDPTAPVIANPVTLYNNYNADVAHASAYTTVNIFQIFLPLTPKQVP